MGVELGLGGLITIFCHGERKDRLGRVWLESITSVIDSILSLIMHTTLLFLSEKVPWSIQAVSTKSSVVPLCPSADQARQ